MDLETYARVSALLDCGDRAGARVELESCGLVHVADLLQLLDGEEVSTYPHLPTFLASSLPAQTYRKQQQQQREEECALSEFIPQRCLVAQTDLHHKRRAIMDANVVLPKPLSFPALRLSQRTDQGESPLPRVQRLPVYISTMWLGCNVLSRETTDWIERQQQQQAKDDDDEAKEETIFATIREFGPTSAVIAALAEWFGISPELVLNICANSSLHALEHGNIRNPHTKLDSFHKLFCPSCLVFDCAVHGPGAFPLKRLASEVRVAEDTSASHCARLFPGDRDKAKRLLQAFDLASSSTDAAAEPFRPRTPDNNCANEEGFASNWHIPCDHSGECTAKNGCACAKSKRKCLDLCACSRETCGKNRFQGCRCHPSSSTTATTCTLSDSDVCTCVQTGRICDPIRCQCQCNCFVGQVALGTTPRVAVGLSSVHQGGWGTFAAQPIAQHEFIAIYHGEVIDQREVKHRLDKNQCNGMFYLFDLGAAREGKVYDLDAFRKGSILKYTNEAKGLGANCIVSVLYGADGRPNVCLFARKAIAQGEELTFDYGPKSNVLE